MLKYNYVKFATLVKYFRIKQENITHIKMERLLTKGSLKSIINNEEVKDPVMQVLGIRKITAVGRNEKYRLLLSDGQNLNSFAMLAIQLNGIISSGELAEFAIVRIKRHVLSNLSDRSKTSKHIMILTDLVVLVSGDVGIKIGDPKPIVENSDQVVENGSSASVDTSKRQTHSAQASDNGLQTDIIDVNNIHLNDSCKLYQDGGVQHHTFDTVDPTSQHELIGRHFRKMEYEKILTAGSWKSMMNNENINESIMQVLNIEMLTNCWGYERFRLLLSDGYNSYSYVMLASKLNNKVLTGILGKFSIIWITDYIFSELCSSETSTKVMIIEDLNVLVSGVLVGLKIGNPKPIINSRNEIDTADPSVILKENNVLSKSFDIFQI